MLDDFSALRTADAGGFFTRLRELPGSYDGPDGRRAEPYGLIAFGEAAPLSRMVHSWTDAPLIVSGTQFMVASGFDYGEVGTLKLTSELTQAEVVVLGHAAYEPAFRVEPGVLSLYTYASYLAFATGHEKALGEAEGALAGLRDRLGPEVETARNPAKTLAWALWNRVPLLLSSRADAGLNEALQHVFARVGKSLAIAVSEHPLEVLSGAFEGRHGLADDVVALVLGAEDEEMKLAAEVLGTRVAQLERLDSETLDVTLPTDPAARSLVLWYAALFVAAYLAVLHGMSPEDSAVYNEVGRVAGV